ncbi:MAG: DUF2784 domain-containing protein [Sideroxyarcus sp.]|nr:DUF2784 domain-containing protein [Sideroxyarcus sp.]
MLPFLADLVLLIHALFVLYVIAGFAAILLGWYLHWRWIRNWWFRTIHLAAIGFVMAEAWLGLVCPLTVLENLLRTAAGDAPYSLPFFQHWVHEFLFYDFPNWVFTFAYTAFAIMILLSWLMVPPNRRQKD